MSTGCPTSRMSLLRRTVPSGIVVYKIYLLKINRIVSPIFPHVLSVMMSCVMSHMTKISSSISLWTTWSSSSLNLWNICTMRQCFLVHGLLLTVSSRNSLMTRPTCGGTGIGFLSKMLIWLFLNKKGNTRRSGSIASTTKSIFKRKASKIVWSTRISTIPPKSSQSSNLDKSMVDSLRMKRLSC